MDVGISINVRTILPELYSSRCEPISHRRHLCKIFNQSNNRNKLIPANPMRDRSRDLLLFKGEAQGQLRVGLSLHQSDTGMKQQSCHAPRRVLRVIGTGWMDQCVHCCGTCALLYSLGVSGQYRAAGRTRCSCLLCRMQPETCSTSLGTFRTSVTLCKPLRRFASLSVGMR